MPFRTSSPGEPSADVTASAPTVEPDRDDPRGLTMVVGGVPSSYVHLDDPTRLEFEYMRWAGDVVDVMAPAGEPVHTVHVGGAGCTLARYVAATRSRSRQVVLEVDPEVVALARSTFGYSRRSGFRLREADGLQGLLPLEAHSFDLVIRDAFSGDRTPDHLTTTQFVGQVRRVLSSDGIYLANIADRPGLGLVKQEVATAATVFGHVALVGETQHLRGRRYGNVLLVASSRPLPVADLTRQVAKGAVPARVVPPADTRALARGVAPRTAQPGQ